ncbi:MAG TPA: peptidyl-prolyl cis-trans isomerase [Candidatus Eisenbacteria bacterium]|nr:peptidyl-prolyl cis-trans isomerase [Candidatus Eisenbacteria bacterium]
MTRRRRSDRPFSPSAASRLAGAVVGRVAALVLLAAAAVVAPRGAEAKVPPALRGPIATVGERTVEAVDIEQAALSHGVDPPKGMTPRAWRRTLLDRCVDRELLALEAERRGIVDDPDVDRNVTMREFTILMGALYQRVLVPGIQPTPAQFDSIKATGRYRWLDLDYILLRDGTAQQRRAIAVMIATRAKEGARWDSLARMYSGHPPSAAAGGHFGPVLVKDVEPAAHDSLRTAKVGDIFGPFSGPYGHEVYRVHGWIDVPDDSTMKIVVEERTRLVYENYYNAILRKYHLVADTLNAKNAIQIFRDEDPDSILASLRPDGTRPGLGVRPGVGIVARAEGVGVTIADLIKIGRPGATFTNRIPIHDIRDLLVSAARVVLHELVVRDARERGLDKDPVLARQLRLARDEVATKTMVARARPADPSAAQLRAYIEKNASRYWRPAARTARVALFPTADSAMAVLKAWNGVGFPPDSVLTAIGFRVRENAPPGALFTGQVGKQSIPERSNDPLSLALRALAPGQFAPVTATVQGYAVAMMTGHEEAAPMSPDEAAPRALRDWREEKEDQWVDDQLERLRAKTPVSVIPARLEAVRIAPTPANTPTPRKRASR